MSIGIYLRCDCCGKHALAAAPGGVHERQRIDEQFVDRAHHAPETGEQRDEQPMRDNYERYTK